MTYYKWDQEIPKKIKMYSGKGKSTKQRPWTTRTPLKQHKHNIYHLNQMRNPDPTKTTTKNLVCRNTTMFLMSKLVQAVLYMSHQNFGWYGWVLDTHTQKEGATFHRSFFIVLISIFWWLYRQRRAWHAKQPTACIKEVFLYL